MALAASISLDRGPVVLGRTESVGVTLAVEEPPAAADRPLRVSVNVGTFSEVTRTDPGRYRSIYTPPKTLHPQVALVAVWRETGAEAPIEFLRVPLYGSMTVPVTARPHVEVKVEVAIDSFGPVITDAKGRAQVPILVPPGVFEATVAAKEKDGALVRRPVRLKVPPYNRLTAALVPHAVVADGNAWARLEVFYDQVGSETPADRVKVVSSQGGAVLTRAYRSRYVYRYVPPAGATAKSAHFSVTVEGDPTSTASAAIALGLPAAARLVVRPPERPIPADGRSTAPMTAFVFDATGLGLPGLSVKATANGQSLAVPVDRGDGQYEFAYIAPPTYPPGGLVRFSVTGLGSVGPAVTATANYQLQAAAAPRSLTARLTPSPVPADGWTEAILSLDVRDGAGMPLQGAQLMLVASHGRLGQLARAADGTYQATYVAPERPPEGDTLVRVVDATGSFEQSVAIPLRHDPGRFLLGVRAGANHSLRSRIGPRVGLDVWMPWRVGSQVFTFGVSGTVGLATLPLADDTGTLSLTAESVYVPIAARIAWEALAGRRLAGYLGAGGIAAFARFWIQASGVEAQRWGFGALGFAQAALSVGPGQLFVDVSLGWAPVSALNGDFSLNTGGLGVEAGYRLAIF